MTFVAGLVKKLLGRLCPEPAESIQPLRTLCLALKHGIYFGAVPGRYIDRCRLTALFMVFLSLSRRKPCNSVYRLTKAYLITIHDQRPVSFDIS